MAENITPELKTAHFKLLRNCFSKGRPLLLQVLDGVCLDLISRGYLKKSEQQQYSHLISIEITQLGVELLSEKRQETLQNQKPHHDLASRLASHLKSKGYLSWENIQFYNPDKSALRIWSSARPDVFAFKATLLADKASCAIYEIKVSRSDFLADLAKPEKRRAYQELAGCVYYVCEENLIKKEEVPSEVGLIYETKEGFFKTIKRAKKTKNFKINPDTLMTLIVKSNEKPWG